MSRVVPRDSSADTLHVKGTVLLTIASGKCQYFLEVIFMPRTARKRSSSGIYHVLLRGIGQQNIFEEDMDKQRFCALKQLKDSGLSIQQISRLTGINRGVVLKA